MKKFKKVFWYFSFAGAFAFGFNAVLYCLMLFAHFSQGQELYAFNLEKVVLRIVLNVVTCIMLAAFCVLSGEEKV